MEHDLFIFSFLSGQDNAPTGNWMIADVFVCSIFLSRQALGNVVHGPANSELPRLLPRLRPDNLPLFIDRGDPIRSN